MDSFDIILLSKQISAVKRAFYVRTCPFRKRKAQEAPRMRVLWDDWDGTWKVWKMVHRQPAAASLCQVRSWWIVSRA